LPARDEKINIKTGDPVLFDRNKYLYIPERFLPCPPGESRIPVQFLNGKTDNFRTMNVEEIRILVHEYKNADELQEESRKLVEQAREASRRAYAPYSQFRVGAAVLLENGEIITGNNQENSAYPSGLCAERIALFYAGSRFPDVPIVKIAIAAFHKEKYLTHPVYPCGDCRQVMLEYELRGRTPIQIILYGSEKIKVLKSAKDMLPLPFVDDFGL